VEASAFVSGAGQLAAEGYESVADVFRAILSAEDGAGGALAVVVDGKVVLDIWGGVANEHGRAWSHDTIACVFSGSKGLVATCVLMLLDRGELDLDRPVSYYWPEFAAEGKDQVLVRHVVSHRSGLPGLATAVTVEEATDDVRMARLLAMQAPQVQPGTWHAYHALTYGWMCGEIVRRVTGHSVGQFFHDEVAVPLGLDAWIGLPPEMRTRLALLRKEDGFGAAPASAGDPVAWSIFHNPPRFSGHGVHDLAANEWRWLEAEVPASNAVVSARALARLYGCLARGGEIDNVRLLSDSTLARGRQLLTSGRDAYAGVPAAFGVGFALQTEAMPFGPARDGFGHGGAGGSIHGAWPGLKTGFSFVPRTLHGPDSSLARSQPLLNTLHAAILRERPRGDR
jgi:CubicO group peptidase (beta-lactamase class C family)